MTTTEAALAIGAQAPDIELETADEAKLDLASFWAGRPVALIFLHGLDTQFAIELAVQWRDAGSGIGEAGGGIVAISDASPAAVAAFHQRWSLPFPLLSDLMCRSYAAFGVSPELPGCFVIDSAGLVRYAHHNTEPLDSPSTWALVDIVSSITGTTVERPEPVVVPSEEDAEPAGAPSPGQHELNFTCAKCQSTSYEVLDVSTASGMMSRMMNLQNRRFSAVVCQHCRFVEFYQTQSGKLRNIADLIFGS